MPHPLVLDRSEAGKPYRTVKLLAIRHVATRDVVVAIPQSWSDEDAMKAAIAYLSADGRVGTELPVGPEEVLVVPALGGVVDGE